MLETPRCFGGMVTAPHHLAAQAGRDILKAGGTAVEAAVAMGAALSVVYPHMTGIGGDGFWLIAAKGEEPTGIDAAGCAGHLVEPGLYRKAGLDSVPWRGPLAANTVAGTISGWKTALDRSAGWSDRPLPLETLLEAAIEHAGAGIAVTRSQSDLTASHRDALSPQPGFREQFMPDDLIPAEGARLRLPALAETFRRLAAEGLDSFYRGSLARLIAADLEAAGSPLRLADLERFHAREVAPLSVETGPARLFNLPAPTQGLASLMILAIFERLKVADADGFAHIHGLVEATKQAFLVRDRVIGDPGQGDHDLGRFLTASTLDRLAAAIDMREALAWPQSAQPGDTIWCGAIDAKGNMASFIQSIFFEFGSGVVLPSSGITWQNRGASFLLDTPGPRQLAAGRTPFHTLNPAMAYFKDGRRMVYGTMGGEGQPQTQAALFSRYAFFGQPLQRAITAPRWLLGKTWGESTFDLKVESRLDRQAIADLRAAGHDVAVLDDYTSVMGHAGALVRHPSGLVEGATDPRSDGAAAGQAA
jgi:gamma-glutamyltranspeptidase/glutathione hydrolase